MLAIRGKGTIMKNITTNDVNITINGAEIEISGTGTLRSEDISRVNFELATVTIKGFDYINSFVAYCFTDAFEVIIDETVKSFDRMHCKDVTVSYPLAWGKRDNYKTLADIKEALRFRRNIDDSFVYNIYPVKFSSDWDGKINGYLLTTCITKFIDNKFVDSDRHYYFIGVNKHRRIFSKQETHIHQKIVETFELSEDEFVARVHLCGVPSDNWLNDVLIEKPTEKELQVLEENNMAFLASFETNLFLDMNKCLRENISPIFRDENLQEICKKHIPDFRVKVFEKDSFGPIVVGFIANGKEYAI